MNKVYLYLSGNLKLSCLKDGLQSSETEIRPLKTDDVWRKLSDIPGGFLEESIHKLPRFRQKQCNRYRQESDKINCVISYFLLLMGLSERYGIDSSVEFIYNEYGKPYLRDYPHIFFNISHCNGAIACALDDFEIGVDIQDVQEFDRKVAEKICTETELNELAVSDNPARLFCKMWTARESYAKAMGIGIAGVLKCDFDKSHLIQMDFGDKCLSLYRLQ